MYIKHLSKWHPLLILCITGQLLCHLHHSIWLQTHNLHHVYHQWLIIFPIYHFSLSTSIHLCNIVFPTSLEPRCSSCCFFFCCWCFLVIAAQGSSSHSFCCLMLTFLDVKTGYGEKLIRTFSKLVTSCSYLNFSFPDCNCKWVLS